jgi:hypothetical protein
MGTPRNRGGQDPSLARRANWRFGLAALGACVIAGLLVALGCRSGPDRPPEEPPPPPWFQDVTAEAGLNFQHDEGPLGDWFMPQVMGSGVALFDFDGDGRLDAYLLQNGGPRGGINRLYRGLPGGTFRDVTAGSGLGVAGHWMGVAVGDVNNDGRPDVLLTGYQDIRLFLNNGDGTFTDATRQSGLEEWDWGTSAAFFDYDRDGWLDLVVVHYIAYDPARECEGIDGQRDYCGPNVFPGTVTRLWHNRGPGPGGGVRFEDVTKASGLAGKPGPGLGVVCADFDGDGWPDVFVTNDGKANHLWVNQRNGTFHEEAAERGLAYNGHGMPQGNMGIAVGDVDGDGLFDVFVTHLTDERHTLYQQSPRGRYQDRTVPWGLAGSLWRGTGFGTVLADFNHDGAPDLALVNGRVLRGMGPGEEALGAWWAPYGERNQLFANDGAGRFRDLSPTDPFGRPAGVSRGLAWGDVDGDGAVDLLVTAAGGPARLYRNVAPKAGHWLLVRALDPARKRDAVGAVVAVQAGGRRWVGAVNPGSSYLSSGDPRAHFGLGPADRVDAIRVRWPDGDAAEEVFSGGPADRVVTLRRGEGKTAGK